MSFEGQNVLVTGACGTIGSELVRQIAETGATRIVCVDNNESAMFFLREQYRGDKRVECYLTDLRDDREMKRRMEGIDIALHSAALKHVELCEQSPTQAVRTNIDGTQNVIEAAVANNVKRCIFTSSDKAVNPTNVMGTSKLMGERLMTATAMFNRSSDTIFASTRFGNVLGSSGSVIPLFKRQIENGGPITLTSPNMTRFIMTIEEAAALVIQSVFMANGGEVFVTKMPVARIEDLAIGMIKHLGAGKDIQTKVIGAKPGEKLYEELMNDEELRRTYDLGAFFAVLPAFEADPEARYAYIKGCEKPTNPYNSSVEEAMSVDALLDYLTSHGII